MRTEGWSINIRPYTVYKFLNSLFLGLSIGIIFTLYEPLSPSVYSVGGIVLAIATIVIAQLYNRIMTLHWFFRLSLFVELVILAMVLYFLLKPYTYMTALLIYIGYQATFSFGSYLLRAETLALENDEILKRIDSFKQFGYLCGMALSWASYKIMEELGITDKHDKVYEMHWILLVVEAAIIASILLSFKRSKTHGT